MYSNRLKGLEFKNWLLEKIEKNADHIKQVKVFMWLVARNPKTLKIEFDTYERHTQLLELNKNGNWFHRTYSHFRPDPKSPSGGPS